MLEIALNMPEELDGLSYDVHGAATSTATHALTELRPIT